MGHMLVTLAYARDHSVGLIEAMDVHDPALRNPPGVVVAHRKALPKSMRERLETAAKPPKKPGLLGRMRRSAQAPTQSDAEREFFGDAKGKPESNGL